MLDGLIEKIRVVRERIVAHRDVFYKNETATRVSLIDPLLESLGWDPADPRKVAIEYTVGQKRCDYVLLGFNGEPVAGIEAKPLGTDLGEYFLDMVDYSTQLKAPYYVMTDGDKWQLYRVFRQDELMALATPGNDTRRKHIINEHHVLSASISGKQMRKSALSVASLWRPDFTFLPPIPARNFIFWPETEFPAPPGWIRLPDLDLDKPKPAGIRFPDGTEYPVAFWNEILKHTVDWLANSDLLHQQHLPVASTRTKGLHIVDANARHANGKPFRNSEPVPKLAAKWQKVAAKDQIMCDALTLLERCDQDGSEVFVTYAASLLSVRLCSDSHQLDA